MKRIPTLLFLLFTLVIGCDLQGDDLLLEPCVTVSHIEYDTRLEQDPEPIGGIAAITQDAGYPEIARKAFIEGTVYLSFSIDEAGNVFDAAVTKGIGAGCDQEGLRLVQTAKFSPAVSDGQVVVAWVNRVRVRFNLECMR